jgi:exonuclease III
MTGITTYLSIVTLNINGLNSPIKRHRLTKCIKKEVPTICCLQETHLTDRNKHRLRMKDWKKIYQANGPWKQTGVAILISDKVDFKPTLIKWGNTPKGNSDYQSIYTQHQCTQFNQTYSEGPKNTHRLQHSGSGRF